MANPSCVDLISQIMGGEGGICGNLDGEGVCRTCPPGTHCRQDPVTFEIRCVCDVSTCPKGCCINNSGFSNNDQCIPNGNGARVTSANPAYDGQFVCGTAGAFCQAVGNAFSGCCNEVGVGVGGTAALECGSNGTICKDCTQSGPNGVCTSQTCVGGATTTTAAPSTTTAAPTTTTSPPCSATCTGCCDITGFPPMPNAKSTCGVNGVACVACGGKQKCTGKGTCKKKH